MPVREIIRTQTPIGVLLGQAKKVAEEAEPADAAGAAQGRQVSGRALFG